MLSTRKSRRNEPVLHERIESLLVENHMIQKTDAEDGTGLAQATSDVQILLTGFEISAWMVMGNHDPDSVVLYRIPEYFPRVHNGPIDQSHAHDSGGDDLMPPIEGDHDEALVPSIPVAG